MRVAIIPLRHFRSIENRVHLKAISIITAVLLSKLIEHRRFAGRHNDKPYILDGIKGNLKRLARYI
jgi:hypothetical protein